MTIVFQFAALVFYFNILILITEKIIEVLPETIVELKIENQQWVAARLVFSILGSFLYVAVPVILL